MIFLREWKIPPFSSQLRSTGDKGGNFKSRKKSCSWKLRYYFLPSNNSCFCLFKISSTYHGKNFHGRADCREQIYRGNFRAGTNFQPFTVEMVWKSHKLRCGKFWSLFSSVISTMPGKLLHPFTTNSYYAHKQSAYFSCSKSNQTLMSDHVQYLA